MSLIQAALPPQHCHPQLPSMQVALGMAKVGAGEVMYDQRLFNQEQGMASGFGADDGYNAYDKPLFVDRRWAFSVRWFLLLVSIVAVRRRAAAACSWTAGGGRACCFVLFPLVFVLLWASLLQLRFVCEPGGNIR